MQRPISAYLAGLSATRIFTRIYRSVCNLFDTVGILSLSLSLFKASVLRSSSPRDVIRKEKRKKQRKGGKRKREEKTRGLTWSCVMSMNFYIEMLSHSYREGRIRTKRFPMIITYVRAYHRRFRRFFFVFFLSSRAVSLTSCAEKTCHTRREFFILKLQYFLSVKYIQI